MPNWKMKAQDKLDLLESVSMIDEIDLTIMLQQFHYETVQSEIIRALTTLEELHATLYETYKDKVLLDIVQGNER